MKEWLNKKAESERNILILAFLIPFAIMVGVSIYHGIYPFGNQCILHIDMYHQYCPFTVEFLNKLRSGGSLMYSWNLGIGSDFMAMYAYYLASPMNWLVLLCPKAFVIEFMTILIWIKIGLCGTTFAYYLRRHYQTKSLNVLLFAVFYALSGFTCAYNWDIMWLDGVWLAPLIILGLERLVNEKKCGMYYVTLALSIFSNYYISIMICIFLVFYYFILLMEKTGKKEVIKTTFRFGIYSLLAGGTSAILLIPEIKVLAVSGSGGIEFPTAIKWYFSALSEMARSCIGVTVATTEGDWPNLYAGCAVLLLVFLYVLNRQISWKKKVKRILFLAFFLVSFANNILTFFWHGLDFPDGLPCRQTFLYIFLLLTVCYETVHYAKGNRPIHVGISLIAGTVLVLVFAMFTDHKLVTMNSLVITALLLGAYALVFLFYIQKDEGFRTIGCIFAFIIVITEATVNLDSTSLETTNRTSYTANLAAYQTLMDKTAATDQSFYRTDKYNRLTKNESCLTGYRSASIFSSLMNISVGDFYRSVGMEGGKNFYCYNGATPLLSSMLSVKYLMTDSAKEESPLRTLVDSDNGINLYENKYTLPLGFMVSPDLERKWEYNWGTPIEVQNRLAKQLGAKDDLFTPIDTKVENQKTTVTVLEDSYVIGHYSDNGATTITANYGDKTRTFSKADHVYLLDLGWCKAGTKITLTPTDSNILQMQAYKLNMDSMNTAFNTLNEQTMKLQSYSSTSVKGSIHVKTAGDLILSIPKEDGWSAYVDGKSVPMNEFCKTFINIPMTVGTHQIELRYCTPGILPGALISLTCLVLFAILMLLAYRRKKNMPEIAGDKDETGENDVIEERVIAENNDAIELNDIIG
jgi:uncharacterized membrane protein YfhO